MAYLFGRAYSLVIGTPPVDDPNAAQIDSNVTQAAYQDLQQGLDVSGFDIEFTIERKLTPTPHAAKFSIFNLGPQTRLALGQDRPLVIQLVAGYKNATNLLYLGTCSSVWNEQTEKDVVTHIESGDSEVQFSSGRLTGTSTQGGANVPVGIALQIIVDALGVYPGNLFTITQALEESGIKEVAGGGLYGSAAKRLTDLLRSAGFTWCIINGTINVLGVTAVINPGQAVVCSNTTGLVSSPTVDNKGIVSAKMLLQPGLALGTLVSVQSKFVTGTYKIQQIKYVGQTAGSNSPWFAEWKGTKYSAT